MINMYIVMSGEKYLCNDYKYHEINPDRISMFSPLLFIYKEVAITAIHQSGIDNDVEDFKNGKVYQLVRSDDVKELMKSIVID